MPLAGRAFGLLALAMALRCRIVLVGIKRRFGAPPDPRPSARLQSGHAAWRLVPDDGGTPGRPPYASPAAPTERTDRSCRAAAQIQPYDRHRMAGHRTWSGATDGPGLRSSALAHRAMWLITVGLLLPPPRHIHLPVHRLRP